MEAFDQSSDLPAEETKLTVEHLVNELESFIFDFSGKNSKDKSYREKAKKIITRVKGSRNGFIRTILRSGMILPSEFCKLNEKQLDDDAYYEKFRTNGNVQTETKPKSGIRPPLIKNIPIHSIDLSSNTETIDEYYNKTENEAKEEKLDEVTEEVNNPNNPSKPIHQISLIDAPVIDNNFNLIEDNLSNKINTTEIETNSVKTDSFSVREDLIPIPAETGKTSPRQTNGRSIQFNPPSKTSRNNATVLNNQTLDVGASNTHRAKEISTALNTTMEEVNSTSKGNAKQSDKLKELKELMERQKQGKVIIYN